MTQILDGGLILRALSDGHATDRERIAAFYRDTFGEAGEDDTLALHAWVEDLVSGTHPAVTPEDIWVVVDPAHDEKIVSALLLIPQTWQYGGEIPVPVGRVELVATDKDYRRRGLIRQLMNVAHARSESLGHLMQGITGIAHYYRRFGYTMAVDLGFRAGLELCEIKDLPEGETAKYTLRPATDSDIPNLIKWDTRRAARSPLSHIRTPELWQYELHGRNPLMPFAQTVFIIVNEAGEDVGYIGIRARNDEQGVFCSCACYNLGERASYLETFDDVMRGLRDFINGFYTGDKKPTQIYFDAGMHETLDLMFPKTAGGKVWTQVYAWYIRVENLPRFLRHVAPVLERRLAAAGMGNYTGSLKIGFFDLTGLEITFENGHLANVEHRAFDLYEGDMTFPYHTFLNVLFGHRTAVELASALPEVRVSRKAVVLSEALFPRQRAWLVPLA